MNKKILLLEPYYKRDLPPLSFMKLSSKHKREGDEVMYHRGDITFLNFEPDIVYITSLFTWDYNIVKQTLIMAIKKYNKAEIMIGGGCAGLMQDKLRKDVEGEYKIHFGVDLSFEFESPDYDLFNMDYVIGFTSRGCVNKCGWCCVPKLEPNFIESNDWESCIKKRFHERPDKVKKIILMDNNFLASSLEHIKKVTTRLKAYNRPVDFNQALDIQLFKGEKAKCFKGLKMQPFRLAWDSKRVKNVVIDGLKLAMEYGQKDFAVLMLYNFDDKPQEIYDRIRTLAEIGSNVMVFLMKYQPLDTMKKGDYIGTHWCKELIQNFGRLRSKDFVNGILRFNNIEHFESIFGKSGEEFLDKLKNLEGNQDKKPQNKLFDYLE